MKRLIPFLFLLLAFKASAATRIEAWISITNLPGYLTNQLTWNSTSNRVWTNAVANPVTQIMATNNIQNSRTNLKVNLDTYKFRNWHQIQWGTNTNDVVILAGTNEPITIAVAGNWASVRYVTNTVYLSDFLLVPPNSGQSNNFLIWQWTAVATNLSKGTQALEATSFPFTNFPHSKRTVNPPLTNQPIYGGAIRPSELLATNGALRDVSLSNAMATNLTGSITNPAILGGTNWWMVMSNAIYGNIASLVVSNLNALGGSISNVTVTNSPWINGMLGGLTNGQLFNTFISNSPSIQTTNMDTLGGLLQGVRITSGSYATGFLNYGTMTLRANGSYTVLNMEAIWDAFASSTNWSLMNNDNGIIYLDIQTANGGSFTIPTLLTISNNLVVTTNATIYGTLNAGNANLTNVLVKGTNAFDAEVKHTPRTFSSSISGYVSALSLGTNSYVRVTGASGAVTNSSFKGGYAGLRVLVEFVNPSRSCVLLDHSSIGTPASTEKINLGITSGGLLNMTNDPAMFELIHNGTEWIKLWNSN